MRALTIEQMWEENPLGVTSPFRDPRCPRIRDVIKATIETTDVSYNEIIADRRAARVVRARHIGMYVAYQVCRAGLTRVGSVFGGRDHTTVLHAVNKIKRQISDGDVVLASDCQKVQRRACQIWGEFLKETGEKQWIYDGASTRKRTN